MKQRLWDDALTRQEVADLLGIKVESLNSAICRGYYKFPTYTVGGKKIHRKSEVVSEIETNHAA